MSGHSEDRDFDDYLRGDSPVSRRYRDLPGDEVPPALDRTILAQAREAVQDPAERSADRSPTLLVQSDDLAHVRRQQRRLMKWAIPTTLAACALLGVSVVMRSQLPHAPVTQEAVRVEAPAAPAPAARAETSKPQSESESLVLIAPPRNAATEFSELASARDAEARAARSREQAKRQESHSIAQQAEVARQAMSDRRLAVAPPRALDDRAAGQVAAAAPAPAPPATAAARAKEQEKPGSDNAAESLARAQVESDALEQIIVTRLPAHRSGPRGTVTRRGSTAAEDQSADSPRAPEEWLEDIRKLREGGEDRQADEQWREFRKQYPDYEVSATDLARGESRD